MPAWSRTPMTIRALWTKSRPWRNAVPIELLNSTGAATVPSVPSTAIKLRCYTRVNHGFANRDKLAVVADAKFKADGFTDTGFREPGNKLEQPLDPSELRQSRSYKHYKYI